MLARGRFAADSLIGEARLPLMPLLQQPSWQRDVPLLSSTPLQHEVRGSKSCSLTPVKARTAAVQSAELVIGNS